MAVIGIIVLLMSILIPSITRAVRHAQRTRMQYDLQSIATALESYKHDHREYPPVPRGSGLGANILARALIGPAPTLPTTGDLDFDGAEGPGFRTRSALAGAGGTFVQQGKVWGPYLPPDQFRARQIELPPGSNTLHWVIVDMKDTPILYFPARPGADINKPNGYVALGGGTPPALFELADNFDTTKNSGLYLDVSNYPAPSPPRAADDISDWLADFRVLMGAKLDGSAGDALAPHAPFLLWSAGPDQLWGARDHRRPPDPGVDHREPLDAKNPSDDVFNVVR